MNRPRNQQERLTGASSPIVACKQLFHVYFSGYNPLFCEKVLLTFSAFFFTFYG